MRNVKSLIEDDDAMGGGCAFVIIAAIASLFGFVEGQLLTILTLCPCSLPAWSSVVGSLKGSLCTWFANILMA